MSKKPLQPIDIDLVNQGSFDSGEDTPITNVVRDSFNNSRRPSLKLTVTEPSDSEYSDNSAFNSPWTPMSMSTLPSTTSSLVPSLPSFPPTPAENVTPTVTYTKPPTSHRAPITTQGATQQQYPQGMYYNSQFLNSPVLKVFNQQPFRFFPSIQKKSQQDLRSESLDVPSTSAKENPKHHRMPKTRSFGFSTDRAILRSMDSSESSFPMQPIYVFHNMNTMQQRLGIPYYNSNTEKSGKHGKHGTGSNILRNYYLVHGHLPKGGEDGNQEGGSNISPIPLQTPRELFDAHHTMNSTSTTGHNVSNSNINIAAAREKLLLKYNLFAHNIASAGETHLSLLYETCLVQYEDILVTMADFIPTVCIAEEIEKGLEAMSTDDSVGNYNNDHMKSIFNRMGMSNSNMSLMDEYGSIRVESSASYKSSSSEGSRSFSRSNSSKSMSEDDGDVTPGQDDLVINVSPFDYEKGNASIVMMRYLDVTSAYSEVLQLQSKENEALVILLRSFEKTASFVSRYLPSIPPSILQPETQYNRAMDMSSSNSVSKPIHHEASIDLHSTSGSSITSDASQHAVKLDDAVLQEMHKILMKLLKEINGGEPVLLEMTLPQLLERLNNNIYMHVMYAIVTNIRRLSVLLKCTGKMQPAHIAAKTSVHIFQALSNSFVEHRADLISAYSLLASILDERGLSEESLKIDHKAMELAAQLQATSIRLAFPFSSPSSSNLPTPLGEIPAAIASQPKM